MSRILRKLADRIAGLIDDSKSHRIVYLEQRLIERERQISEWHQWADDRDRDVERLEARIREMQAKLTPLDGEHIEDDPVQEIRLNGIFDALTEPTATYAPLPDDTGSFLKWSKADLPSDKEVEAALHRIPAQRDAT